MALLDLNDFRFFNDVYGTGSGTRALRAVSDRLRAACGPGDVVARFGGDQFAPAAAGRRPGLRFGRRGGGSRRAWGDRPPGRPPGGEPPASVPVTFTLAAALITREAPDRHEALRLAQERLRWLKTGGATESEAQEVRAEARSHAQGFFMLDALVSAVDNKDRYTRRHSEDVLGHSLRIAHALGWTKRRGTPSGWPPCCTTSARSASRTPSCGSRAV